MSACSTCFQWDDSVKDEMPTVEDPSPQFSMARENRNGFKSMNGPKPGETDKRPNMWDAPEGHESNLARHYLKGWKVHHSSQRNWARNAYLVMDGWQISDTPRNFEFKSVTVEPGSKKMLTNTLIQGFSKNRGGRRLCKFGVRQSYNILFLVRDKKF